MSNTDDYPSVPAKVVEPTLSVIIPTYRDRWRLAVQLDAVVPQLRECDECVVLQQGECPVSNAIHEIYHRPNLRWKVMPEPLGVCGAYNLAAAMAKGTWIAQLSGNDEWQPGTLAVWLYAARRFPEARIMHGHTIGMTMTPWLEATGFVPSDWLAAIWTQQGWKLHGSSTLIRRDSWGEGYPPTLGYMADQFLAMRLTMLHGCVYLRHKCSYVNFLPSGLSQQHGVQVSRDKEKAEFLRLLRLPENAVFYHEWKIFDTITGWSKED